MSRSLSFFTLLVILVMIFTSCSSGTTVTRILTLTQSPTPTETQSQTTTAIRTELSSSEIVRLLSSAVVHIETPYGAGTGMVIDEEGYILTNNHVVGVMDYATVRIPGRGQLSSEVIYRDPFLDIAILKCPGTGFDIVTLGSIDEPVMGDDVIAIGYPESYALGDAASTSKGIISAFRYYDGIYYIQTVLH